MKNAKAQVVDFIKRQHARTGLHPHQIIARLPGYSVYAAFYTACAVLSCDDGGTYVDAEGNQQQLNLPMLYQNLRAIPLFK